MKLKRDIVPAAVIAVVFGAFYFAPLDKLGLGGPVLEALALAQWYAREHVLLCLVPSFFIAGAIAVFISQGAVIRYLGGGANKLLAYSVASVSGSVLAVCSCTVLPLFSGIYRMGAGLGPATTFLYAGPAINVLAIILTARVLGIELGIARAVGAVVFSVVIGLAMQMLFRKEEASRTNAAMNLPAEDNPRPLWQSALHFGGLIAVLVFATWSRPENPVGFWNAVFEFKWWLTSAAGLLIGLVLVLQFKVAWWKPSVAAIITAILGLAVPEQPLIAFVAAVFGLGWVIGSEKGEPHDWLKESWGFARQILPLLFYGVLIAGLLLGRPGSEGLIPSGWIAGAVGENSLMANLFASVVGAFMYFATLTEIPILQGLLGAGMNKGPALALLLAGPALSLPNMLVIRSVIGTRKTVVFVILVVTMATLSGLVYGSL